MAALKRRINTSLLPNDVLSYTDTQFYNVAKQIVGENAVELLEIQGVRSPDSLVLIPDVFAILDIKCAALNSLKEKLCLKSDDDTYVVKPGIKSLMNYFCELIIKKKEEYVRISSKQRGSTSTVFCITPSSFVTNGIPSTQQQQLSSSTVTTIVQPSSTMPMDENYHRNFIIMFKSLPSDILNYRDDNFYQLVKERCGKDMVEFMGILGISSVQSLLGVENLFSWLEFNSEKLHLIKNKLAFQHDNGFTEVKWGVRNSLECLIRDLQRVNDNYQDIKELMSSNENMILSSLLLQKHSTLKSLIHLYQTLDAENNEHKSENVYFLASFLDNISNNLCCSKNAYRHNEHILRFATSFYILSGRMAYEFVRLNVPGALPSISTLQRLVLNKELRINQAEFRYDLLATHMDSLKTAIAFASEDCTPVIKKISYDSLTNSFVGFPTPLNNGIPINQHYQTDSFEQLREWFSNEDRVPLINIHMIQPITKMQAIPNPFLLCAFGTTNQHQSIDIIRRWIWIVEQCLLKNVRIIGFSTDGDPKYLRAMRLLIGLFASLPNIKLSSHIDAFHVKIPKE
ncbi:unnamed protein product, partial [Rotaria sp. Silwood2]